MKINKLFNYPNILEHILEAGTIDESVFGGKKGGYFISQVPEELSALIYYLLEQGINSVENFLDLNSESGGFIQIMSEFIDIENIRVIDTNHLPISQHRKNIIKNDYEEFIGEVSNPKCKRAIKNWGLMYDIVHIYGRNNYDKLREETFLAKDVLKDQGLLIITNTKSLSDVKRWHKELQNFAMPDFKHLKTIKNLDKKSGISIYAYNRTPQ